MELQKVQKDLEKEHRATVNHRSSNDNNKKQTNSLNTTCNVNSAKTKDLDKNSLETSKKSEETIKVTENYY